MADSKGPGLGIDVGMVISVMISIVVVVSVAKGEKITNTTAIAPTPQTNPQNFLTLPNVGDPNVQLVLLVTLLGAVLLLVFYSIMKAKKKENYSES